MNCNDGGPPRYEINNDHNFQGVGSIINMGNMHGFNMNFQRNIQKLRQDTAGLAENHKTILFNFKHYLILI